MQTQSLSTQDLKSLLQKVIGQPVFEEAQPVEETIIIDIVPSTTESIPTANKTPEAVVEPVSEPVIVEVILDSPVQDAKVVQAFEFSTTESRIIPDTAPIAAKQSQKPKSSRTKKELALETPPAAAEVTNKELNATIAEQQNALDQAKREIERLKSELQTTAGSLAVKEQAATLDNQDAKARLIRLIEDKKELEDKVTLLSGEKATLAARLQSFMQKAIKHEETEFLLTDQIKELTKTLEVTTEELSHAKNLEAELKGKSEALEALEHAYTILQTDHQNATQELAVTKACLHEQASILEQEQQKNRLLSQEHVFAQKRSEEQENHLRLLEQHLARRVKECALLSKQLDDLMDRTSQLQSSLTASSQRCQTLEETVEATKKIEHALRIEFDAQANMMQDALEQKEKELREYAAELEQKNKELAALKVLEGRFIELEELTRRSMQILSTPETPKINTFFSFDS